MSIDCKYMSRKRCSLYSSTNELFFSLADYRNRLFTSSKLEDVIDFYDSFENRNQLIEWMKERPKGASYLYEVEGNKEIVVVIPTADLNGENARNCREKIFCGLHIIFVVSGEIPDPYFTVPHNVNFGIRKAKEYHPKWIVYSGDDMIAQDDVSKLVNDLQKLDNSKVDSVFTKPDKYHSTPSLLAIPNSIFYWSITILQYFSVKAKYVRQIYLTLKRLNSHVFFPRVDFNVGIGGRVINLLFFKKVLKFTNTLAFAIFSSKFMEENDWKLYDEVYVNEMEDTDLSINLISKVCAVIDYKISEYIGTSLGNGLLRTVRVVPGFSYFSYKVDIGAVKIKSL